MNIDPDWAGVIVTAAGIIIAAIITIIIYRKQYSFKGEVVLYPSRINGEGIYVYRKIDNFKVKIINSGNMPGMFCYVGLYPHISWWKWLRIRRHVKYILKLGTDDILNFFTSINRTPNDFFMVDPHSYSEQSEFIDTIEVINQLYRNNFRDEKQKIDVVYTDVRGKSYRARFIADTTEFINTKKSTKVGF